MSAKVDLKFIGSFSDREYIKCEIYEHDFSDSDLRSGKECFIDIIGVDTFNHIPDNEEEFRVTLDISTAIKFAKALRTKINEAKEVNV